MKLLLTQWERYNDTNPSSSFFLCFFHGFSRSFSSPVLAVDGCRFDLTAVTDESYWGTDCGSAVDTQRGNGAEWRLNCRLPFVELWRRSCDARSRAVAIRLIRPSHQLCLFNALVAFGAHRIRPDWSGWEVDGKWVDGWSHRVRPDWGHTDPEPDPDIQDVISG